jgi:hypothetical protein
MRSVPLDPSKRVPIFPGTQEANLKMVPIDSVPISRVVLYIQNFENGDEKWRRKIKMENKKWRKLFST